MAPEPLQYIFGVMSVLNKPAKILAKIIRVVTLPPIAALATLSIFLYCKSITLTEFLIGIACLTILPVLSYAVEPFIRKNGADKRTSQRNLAVLFSVVGYTMCNITAWAMNSSEFLKTFYLTYMLSVLAIFVLGKLFGIKCSGHACGFVGPLVFLGCFISTWYFLGLLFASGLIWASVQIKRHTISELVIGSVVPIVALSIAYLLIAINIFTVVEEQIVALSLLFA